ncbi:MAG: response regulator transcription factor [Solirubrobacterales bacterium]
MSDERCCMIIDAHPVTRLGIRDALSSGEAWSFEELPHGGDALETLRSVGPFEVAVVEMRPAENGSPSGTATIKALLLEQPGLGVVGHGGGIERHALAEALDAGASAYVSKHSSPETMRRAVEAVSDFESFVDPAVDRRGDGKPPITRRQRQILQLLADGCSATEAAEQLNLSAETVRTHAKAILPRLGANNRAHAIAIALRGGLID